MSPPPLNPAEGGLLSPTSPADGGMSPPPLNPAEGGLPPTPHLDACGIPAPASPDWGPDSAKEAEQDAEKQQKDIEEGQDEEGGCFATPNKKKNAT